MEDGHTSLPQRDATAREAKALAHPLRLRIVRLCWQQELTNKELAERLDRDPGTVLYHVRQLVVAGLLEQAPVRTGDSGALEKPYRTKPKMYWLNELPSSDPEGSIARVDALKEELLTAGPESVRTFIRFALHLSPADAAELHRRIMAVLDEYHLTDDDRRDQPAHGGLIVLHQLPD